MGIKSGHDCRLPCALCGDGKHQGRGMIPKGDKWVTCPACGGSGWIYLEDK